MRRSMGLFLVLGAFQGMKHFIPLVDAGTRFVLAGKRYRVVEIPDNPAVEEAQFGCKVKRDRHSRLNGI